MTTEQMTKLSEQNAFIECIVHTESSEGGQTLNDIQEDNEDHYYDIVNGTNTGYVAVVYIKDRKYHPSNLSWRLYEGISHVRLVFSENIEDLISNCIKMVDKEIDRMKN